ncbi:MAG: hypothetical protein ABFD90_13685 [Phycisphaerales bacterium]
MNSEFHQNRTELYVHGLLAVAALLGALILLQVAGFVTASTEARVLAARVDPNGQCVEDVSELLAPARTCAEELKKKNLFIMIPPKQHPVGEVLGILGDEALINGRWYKVGDSVEDAKILAIDPTKVRIAWDGQEKEFSPVESSGGGQGQPERSGPARSGRRPGSADRPQMVVTGSRGGPAGPVGVGRSPEEREKMRQQLRNMSPEERQRAREEMRQKRGARPQ